MSDAAILIGAGLIVVGLGLAYLPLAPIACGGFLLLIGVGVSDDR